MCAIVKEIRTFLNREKLYAWLLIVLLSAYSVMVVLTAHKDALPSPALERIEQFEQQFEKPAAQKEYLEELLREEPALAVAMTVLVWIVCIFILAGIGVHIAWAIRRSKGEPLIRPIGERVVGGWGIGDVIKVIILFLTISMVLGIAVGIVHRIMQNETLANTLLIAHTALTDIVVLGVVIYVVHVRYKQPFSVIGFHKKQVGKDILIGIGGYSALLPMLLIALIALSLITKIFHYTPPPHPLMDIFVAEDGRSPFLIMASLVLACVIGPIIEEIFFRGFCYNALKKRWGVRVALVVTAAFFAAIHQSLFAFFPIFILGFCLAYLYEKRGSLIPSITLHIIHNSLFIGYFFFMKSAFLDKLN